jgi:hypothetical protein
MELADPRSRIRVDYLGIARTFGASWVSERLQAEEKFALYVRHGAAMAAPSADANLDGSTPRRRGKPRFRGAPYIGHYQSTRAPSSGIDVLRFYHTVLAVEASDTGHLRTRRTEEAVSEAFPSCMRFHFD